MNKNNYRDFRNDYKSILDFFPEIKAVIISLLEKTNLIN